MSSLVFSNIEKSHIEFLYKFHLFQEDLQKQIDGKTNYKLKSEVGFIISAKFIEAMKLNYGYDKIKDNFKRENKISNIID